ncbi:lipocalin-like domain-containing protein [Ningiella sp. W23]|uniref:lipocalin-like domain-containing protein n=1 Tax=Ningiella sp. W23 TaxID=3023715 RepID=UPI003757E08B
MFRLIKVIIVTVLFSLFLSACDNDKHNADISVAAETYNGDLDAKQKPPQRINPNFLRSSGKTADPSYQITFPFDHLPHPNFDIEWWYLTSNLKGDDGKAYSLQWTLFRFAQRNRQDDWYQGQIYMAHASLHSQSEHWFEERFAPAGLGNAFVEKTSAGAIELAMDDWKWLGELKNGSLFPSTLNFKIRPLVSTTLDSGARLPAQNGETSQVPPQASVSLKLSSIGPFILQGQDGYSIKSAQGRHASHYYSQPFIQVDGTIHFAEQSEKPELSIDASSTSGTVTNEVKVKGLAWYDHEWSSALVDSETAGWDWMSLHFDNGDKLMAFQMRLSNADGESNNMSYQTGTYIYANGDSQSLLPQDIELSILQNQMVAGRNMPLKWEVNIPSKALKVIVEATKAKSYNPSIFPYYEGAVSFEGTHSGIGFLELTGY